MIKQFHIKNNKLVPVKIFEENRNSWISLEAPDNQELARIGREFLIDKEMLEELRDRDEGARFEQEDNYQLFVLRIPYFVNNDDAIYGTVPFWLIFSARGLLTICFEHVDYLEGIMRKIVETTPIQNKEDIFLHLYDEVLDYYQKYLRSIDQLTKVREKDLYSSIKKSVFPKILQMQKALVYFTISLNSNEKVMYLFFRQDKSIFGEFDSDLLEDVMIEHKQAVEMTQMYTKILSNLTSTFETVISQNLNLVMKRLTFISLILMIPTLVASVFGMNIPLPFSANPMALVIIGSGTAVVTLLVYIVLRLRKAF